MITGMAHGPVRTFRVEHDPGTTPSASAGFGNPGRPRGASSRDGTLDDREPAHDRLGLRHGPG